MHASDMRSDDSGWTLLEITAVVLILGILVSIAIATYQVATGSSQRVTCQSNQHILSTAVIAYEQDYETLPPDLAALEPYVKGRNAYDTCPRSGDEYMYEATSGRITCPTHPAQ